MVLRCEKMELTMTTTLTLSGKGEKTALRLVVDNPDFRPSMHRTDFGKRRDFELLVRLVKNEKYLTREERKALDLANYIEQGFHHRKLGEDEGLVYLTAPPAEDISDAAVKILRERNYNVYKARVGGGGGVRYAISARTR